jgi:predicted nucleic acid-binding protein
LILDTDILIWVLREHPGAIRFVERLPFVERKLSAVSYLEILFGARDATDLNRLTKHISTQYANILMLSDSITESAIQLMERFALSHRPGENDVLIAATALRNGEILATGNVKHFDFIQGLQLKIFKP